MTSQIKANLRNKVFPFPEKDEATKDTAIVGLRGRWKAQLARVPWNDGFGHISMRYGNGALRTDAAHRPCVIASLRPWT